MEAGLWLNGQTVLVSKVHWTSKVLDFAAQTSVSFSYVSDSPSTDSVFKAHMKKKSGEREMNQWSLSGCHVTVGGKMTSGAFISSEKAMTLYGKETLETQHSSTSFEENEKEWIICNLGEVEGNVSISINISFITELLPSSPSNPLRFVLPSIQWLESKEDRRYSLDVDVDVNSSLASLSSPSHPTTTITTIDKFAQVHLSTEEMADDFVLLLTPTLPYSSCVVEKSVRDTGDKYAIMVSLFHEEALPSNLKIDWGGLDVRQVPQHAPKGAAIFYANLMDAPQTTVTLTGDDISPISFTLGECKVFETSLIHQLAARARINELEVSDASKAEIRELGLQAGVSTPYTSVFAKNGRVSLLSIRSNDLVSKSPSSSPESLRLQKGEAMVIDSPTSGRKVYDTKFLLSFREHYTDLPKGLPSIDIILGMGNSTPAPSNNKSKGRKGDRDRRSSTKPTLPPVEPLKPSENRWQRPTADVVASQVLQRNVMGLLNKLTLEKFDALSTQIAAIKVTCFEDLSFVCQMIFEKAVSEQHFCSMYARLCQKLVDSSPSFTINKDNQPPVVQTFKRVLLNMCQKEFEKGLPAKEASPSEKQQPEKQPSSEPTSKPTSEPTSETTPETTPENQPPSEKQSAETEGQEQLSQELLARRRVLGNIRFIGELFKLGLLRETIMHECVMRLLVVPSSAAPNGTSPAPAVDGTPSTQPLPSEEDLEALCKLLKTMGKRLDRPGADRQKMDRYFVIIATLSRNQALPSRNRFMLLDLIDQRKNEWVPRRADNGPKTIAAVHADAEKADRLAKEETALRESGGHRFSNPYLRSSGGIEAKDARDRRGETKVEQDLRSSSESVEKETPKPSKTEDAWEVAGTKNKRGGGSGFQEVKGGRRDSFKPVANGRGGNSSGKDSRDNNWDKNNKKNNTNKGQSQGQAQGQTQSRKQGSGSSSSSNNKDKPKPPKSNVFSSLDAIDEEEESNSSGSSAAPTPRANQAPPQPLLTTTLTPVQLERRTDALLSEYFAINDVPEAVESIKELNTPEFHSQIVVRTINMVLEHNKPVQLEQADTLFAAAFGSDQEGLGRGFEEILENIEDLDIDIPMASRYVATLIGSAIARGSLPFSFLFKALSHLVESGKAEGMVGAALQKIAKDSGETKLLELYDSAQKNLIELFKSGRTKDFVDTFLKSRDLAFLAERLS